MSEGVNKEDKLAILKEVGGVVPYNMVFYSISITYSARCAVDSFGRFLWICKNDEDSADSLFSALQESLTHCAALSRYFWPSRQKRLHQYRGESLRKKFEVTDSSPLRNRKLRDAIEHFDERLDSFLLENDAGSFFPYPIISKTGHERSEVEKIFKLIDFKNNKIIVLDEEFEFIPIIEEARRILILATGDEASSQWAPRR